MRNLIIICTLMLISVTAFGQKMSKSEVQEFKIDSLTQVSQSQGLQIESLNSQVDSLTNEIVKYEVLYDAIKENVLHYNFDPARTTFLIDSLKTARDSASALLFASANVTGKTDSIAFLVKQNMALQSDLDSVRTAWQNERELMETQEVHTLRAVNSLKQLKEFLDQQIITEEEYVKLKAKYLDKL